MQNLAHGRGEAPVSRQPRARGKRHLSPLAAVAQHALGLAVVLHHHGPHRRRHEGRNVSAGLLDKRIARKVDKVASALAEAVPVRIRDHRGGARPVQAHKPRVVALGAVYSLRAKAHHQPKHAGGGIHVRKPAVCATRIANARSRWHEVRVAVARAAHALDEKRHLLLGRVQPVAPAVLQRRGVHGRRIHALDGALELAKPLLGVACVGQKHRVVLAGEGVPKCVLKAAGRSHNDGNLAKVVQDAAEALLDLGRERPVFDALRQRVCHAQVAGTALRNAQRPQVILDDERIEDVRAHVERVVRLQKACDLGQVLLDDLARQ